MTNSVLFIVSLFSELYEKECNGIVAVYWEVKYPFPLSNRDVSFSLCKMAHSARVQTHHELRNDSRNDSETTSTVK